MLSWLRHTSKTGAVVGALALNAVVLYDVRKALVRSYDAIITQRHALPSEKAWNLMQHIGLPLAFHSVINSCVGGCIGFMYPFSLTAVGCFTVGLYSFEAYEHWRNKKE